MIEPVFRGGKFDFFFAFELFNITKRICFCLFRRALWLKVVHLVNLNPIESVSAAIVFIGIWIDLYFDKFSEFLGGLLSFFAKHNVGYTLCLFLLRILFFIHL